MASKLYTCQICGESGRHVTDPASQAEPKDEPEPVPAAIAVSPASPVIAGAKPEKSVEERLVELSSEVERLKKKSSNRLTETARLY